MSKEKLKRRRLNKLTGFDKFLIFLRLVFGMVVFFSANSVVKTTPYCEVASIIGLIISLTSGVQIKISNFLKGWTSQK